MKIIRWGAVVALVLVSVMNAGTVAGNDGLSVVVVVAAVLLGVLGLVAAVGLFRRTAWGRPAALAIAGINLVTAIVALATGTDGAVVGLVVSAVALALSFFARDAAPTRVPAT